MKIPESVVSYYVQNLVEEDIQKTFQECFPWSLGKKDKKKEKKQREESAKIFLCELYGWDKDHVEVEEVEKNLYSVKTYYDYYLFEMRVGE